MPQEIKHTKGELEIIGMTDGSYQILGDKDISNGEAELIASVIGGNVYKNLANATRIKKCWDMHEELIQMIKDLIEPVNNINDINLTSLMEELENKAQNLIKKSEQI